MVEILAVGLIRSFTASAALRASGPNGTASIACRLDKCF